MYHVSSEFVITYVLSLLKCEKLSMQIIKIKKKLILIDKYFISYALKSNELSPENKTNI